MSWRELWFGRLPDINFVLDGWRRQAYWAAVLSIGVTIGLRAGHPELQLVPYGLAEVTLSGAEASMLAELFLLAAIGLIIVVAGRQAFVAVEKE